MSIKEKVSKFWKEHKRGILTVAGAIGLVAVGYCIANGRNEMNKNSDQDLLEDSTYEPELEDVEEEADPCAWNHEWDDDLGFIETAAENLEHIDGYSWIIAGPNSQFNPNDDSIELYLVDPEEYYHHVEYDDEESEE